MIEILPFHAKVGAVNGKPVDGVVLGTSIRGDRVQYQIGYWDGLTWKEIWADAELVESSSKTQRIGFIHS